MRKVIGAKISSLDGRSTFWVTQIRSVENRLHKTAPSGQTRGCNTPTKASAAGSDTYTPLTVSETRTSRGAGYQGPG